MHKLPPPPLILFGLIAAVFCLPAAFADDRERGAGVGASTEGGASLGGTGIDSGVTNQRGTDERDKRFKLQRKPKPTEEPKPAEGVKDPAEPKPPAERGNASSGSTSKRSADLSEEADKQDEEFRRKQRAERRK